MTALLRYEAARHALAVCRSVDEVKGWTDKAAAMQAYGRMAKDKGLETDAAEIRIRAERRLGELLAGQKETVGLAKPGPKSVVADDRTPTLAEAGISKDLSSRAQKLAAVPEAEFEQEIGEWRDRVKQEGERVTARLQARGEGKAPKPDPKDARIAALEDEIEQVREGAAEAVAQAELAAALMETEPAKLLLAKDAEIKRLTRDRDDYMNKCAQLVKQVKSLERRLARYEQAAA
jgi:hypothetical protein